MLLEAATVTFGDPGPWTGTADEWVASYCSQADLGKQSPLDPADKCSHGMYSQEYCSGCSVLGLGTPGKEPLPEGPYQPAIIFPMPPRAKIIAPIRLHGGDYFYSKGSFARAKFFRPCLRGVPLPPMAEDVSLSYVGRTPHLRLSTFQPQPWEPWSEKMYVNSRDHRVYFRHYFGEWSIEAAFRLPYACALPAFRHMCKNDKKGRDYLCDYRCRDCRC